MDKLREDSARKLTVGKAILRWVERFTCILLGLFFAALVVVHIPWAQARLLERLTQGGESESEVNIRCKGFWWVPCLGVHVRELEVHSAGRHILFCREAVLDFSFSIKRPWLVLDRLILKNPALHLVKVNGRFMVFNRSTRKGERTAVSDTHRRGAANGIWTTRTQTLSVQILSGVVTADQNGFRVLDIKGIDGSLTMRMDGEVRAPFLNLDSFTFRD